jgi:nitroimidazol reductase NimA-like FMN-containing flavoprotein (pyridoxamine 5'-phosphate oxidase superfamily)
MPTLHPTGRTTLRRKRDRGSYELETIHAILDEGLVCHVGFVSDGCPVVIPTTYVRIDDDLYLHGATANRGLRTLAEGGTACVTVTLVDGLVLARSTFHHSINYRSVVLFGAAERVDGEREKAEVLHALVEHLVPGRTGDARLPTSEELRATLVVRLPIVEASAKVRTGGPIDDEPDMGLAVWAGEIPLALVAGTPIAAADLAGGIEVPAYAHPKLYADRLL